MEKVDKVGYVFFYLPHCTSTINNFYVERTVIYTSIILRSKPDNPFVFEILDEKGLIEPGFWILRIDQYVKPGWRETNVVGFITFNSLLNKYVFTVNKEKTIIYNFINKNNKQPLFYNYYFDALPEEIYEKDSNYLVNLLKNNITYNRLLPNLKNVDLTIDINQNVIWDKEGNLIASKDPNTGTYTVKKVGEVITWGRNSVQLIGFIQLYNFVLVARKKTTSSATKDIDDSVIIIPILDLNTTSDISSFQLIYLNKTYNIYNTFGQIIDLTYNENFIKMFEVIGFFNAPAFIYNKSIIYIEPIITFNTKDYFYYNLNNEFILEKVIFSPEQFPKRDITGGYSPVSKDPIFLMGQPTNNNVPIPWKSLEWDNDPQFSWHRFYKWKRRTGTLFFSNGLNLVVDSDVVINYGMSIEFPFNSNLAIQQQLVKNSFNTSLLSNFFNIMSPIGFLSKPLKDSINNQNTFKTNELTNTEGLDSISIQSLKIFIMYAFGYSYNFALYPIIANNVSNNRLLGTQINPVDPQKELAIDYNQDLITPTFIQINTYNVSSLRLAYNPTFLWEDEFDEFKKILLEGFYYEKNDHK